MKNLSWSTLLILTVLLAPALTLLAQGSYGGILIIGEGPGEEYLDPFESEAERDSFASFFGKTLPSDVELTWGERILKTGDVLQVTREELLPIGLTWNELPEPQYGCGEYGDLCEDGLSVDIYRKEGDKYIAEWCYVFMTNPADIPLMGCPYSYSEDSLLSFEEEGEYYIYIHRPENIQVSKRDKNAVFTWNTELIQIAHASQAESFDRSAVGGVHISVTYKPERETTLTLPTEGRYEGVRGVVTLGPHPERGYPDDEVFTFKVVYTSSNNTIPDDIEVRVAGNVFAMVPDGEAEEELLRDGDYTNGEQYVATTTLPKGTHVYELHASAGEETYELITKPDSAELLTCTAGYSSIIFIPGIKGSTLYRSKPGLDDRLWFPSTKYSNDVRQLAMDDDGKSIESGIYTKDVLRKVGLGSIDVYGPFIDYLDSLVDQGVIQHHEDFYYDWRHDIRDIVTHSIMTGEDSSYSMTEKLIGVATSSSDSGRVIVVGHSMGGLVGKVLLSEVTEEYDPSYIEKFIMVGTPQLGTPDAVAAILHGYGQGAPLLLSDSDARKASQNMLSAMELLPIGTTYNLSNPPIITFGTLVQATEKFRDAYGEEIDTDDELDNFLIGTWAESTSECSNSDDISLSDPVCLNENLLDQAVLTRNFLESWSAPENIEVIELAGINKPTINSVAYKQKGGCVINDDHTCLAIDPHPLGSGDGTVVRESAQAQEGATSYQIDLTIFNEFSHKDLLSIQSVQNVISHFIERLPVDLPEGIKENNTTENNGTYIASKFMSPVAFSLEDTQGRQLYVQKNTELDVDYLVNDIPNVQYFKVGDTQTVVAPTSERYELQIKGTASGTLQIEIEEYEDGVLVKERIHENIPVTDRLTSTFALTAFDNIGSITIDTDGDGIRETVLSPEQDDIPEEIIKGLRTYVKNLHVKRYVRRSLLWRIKLLDWFNEYDKIRYVKRQIYSTKWMLRLYVRFGLIESSQKEYIEKQLDELKV